MFWEILFHDRPYLVFEVVGSVGQFASFNIICDHHICWRLEVDELDWKDCLFCFDFDDYIAISFGVVALFHL